ncbi:MAG: hypothetical protein IJL83_04805 [Clostridia bacterium]|nr:hypothetical protein [Clostridia bacterium]
MKKAKRISFCCVLAVLPLLLTACEAHIGNHSFEVPWYFIAIPVALFTVLVFVIAGIAISKNTYVCTECSHRFHPKWWKAAVSLHMNSSRLFKCPNCGHKGFFRKESN